MRVPVEDKVRTRWRSVRRDVLEVKNFPVAFKPHRCLPIPRIVAVPVDDRKRHTERNERIKCPGKTHVPEVPYFVGVLYGRYDRIRQAVVGV
jgi:hypothetical protein